MMMRAILVLAVLLTGVARAQDNPVYFDDAPRARDTIEQTPALVASGNIASAARTLQRLLDEEGGRVIESADDPDLFISVRRRVHEVLLDSEELLSAYREIYSPQAAAMLAEGEHRRVERTLLLTPAGFEGALRAAQVDLESGRFHAAALALEQLDRHPERTGELGAEAAVLAATVARYARSPSSVALAERWANDATLGAQDTSAADRPDSISDAPVWSLSGNQTIDTGAMLTSPLHSVRVMPEDIFEMYFAGLPNDTPERRAQRRSQPWMFPVVVDDTVYVNDGSTISAWDRFTLALRWRAQPPMPDESLLIDEEMFGKSGNFATGSTQVIDDVSTLTVADGVVFATTGIAVDGGRDGDGRVHAFDAETGAWIWSTPVASLDDQLRYVSVRGPIIAAGENIIVAARKSITARRLVGMYFVALDAATGELEWVRPLGSAGVLPYRNPKRATPTPLLDEGLVYRIDDIGYLCAVEAATGRTRWIRRVPSIGIRPGPASFAWSAPTPVLHDTDIYVLSPDSQRVLRFDRRSGAFLGDRSASLFGQPKYLVGLDGHLAGVSASAAAFVRYDDFDEGRVRSTGHVRSATLNGRAFESGGRLVLPLDTGLMLVDPESPDEPELLELDHRGNMIGLESQLLVIDATDLHSYLVWDVASGLLQRRMEEQPDDAGPAITYAELAFLSQRNDRVVGAVEHAAGAIRRSGDEGARRRLITALSDMINRSQRGWFDEAATNPSRPDDEAPTDTAPETGIDDPELLARVLDLYGEVARSPDEMVFHLLASGRLGEIGSDIPNAVASYQQVLDDPRLAGASWAGAGITVRAEREATRRLTRLLEINGASIYAPFDEEAALERAVVGEAAPPDVYEALARRYPISEQAPALWIAAGEMYAKTGASHRAIAALRSALDAARFNRSVGRAGEPGTVGELAGRLITALAEAERVGEAAEVLRSIADAYPGEALTVRGVPIEADRMSDELASRIAARDAAPTVGTDLLAEVQRLEGWRRMVPLTSRGARPVHDRALFLSAPDRAVALFVGGMSDPEMRRIWTRPVEGQQMPVLVRLDADAAYLYEPIGDQGRLIRLDAATGEQEWATPVFTEMFGDDEQIPERLRSALGPNEIFTPLDNRVRLLDLVITLDEQTALIAERSGRAAAIDLTTGRVLWAEISPVSEVYDIDARGGVAAIAGVRTVLDNLGAEQRTRRPIAVALNLRTGELLQQADALGSNVRWVRVAASGDMIVGLETRIVSFGVLRGLVNWTMNEQQIANSRNAWVFDDRLFVLGDTGDLWFGSVETGRIKEEPLLTDRRLITRSPVVASRSGGRVSFTTARGLLLFGPDGTRVGIDALEGFDSLTPPARAENVFVTMETIGEVREDESASYALYMLDRASAKQAADPVKLILDHAPRELTLLDGRVLISAGGSTVVLRAPVSP